jgi:hypothetical protein
MLEMCSRISASARLGSRDDRFIDAVMIVVPAANVMIKVYVIHIDS